MPCLEISLPKLSVEKKEKVAELLTEAFASTTGHDASIFGVRFFEYEENSAANGGKLINSKSPEKPYLHFLLYCPRLKRNTKEKMVKALTESFVIAVENTTWLPVIHICEHPYDNVAIEGEILSSKFKECSEKNFYYELPND